MARKRHRNPKRADDAPVGPYTPGTCFHPHCEASSKYDVLHCDGRGRLECCAGHFKWMKKHTTDRVEIRDMDTDVVVWKARSASTGAFASREASRAERKRDATKPLKRRRRR